MPIGVSCLHTAEHHVCATCHYCTPLRTTADPIAAVWCGGQSGDSRTGEKEQVRPQLAHASLFLHLAHLSAFFLYHPSLPYSTLLTLPSLHCASYGPTLLSRTPMRGSDVHAVPDCAAKGARTAAVAPITTAPSRQTMGGCFSQARCVEETGRMSEAKRIKPK